MYVCWTMSVATGARSDRTSTNQDSRNRPNVRGVSTFLPLGATGGAALHELIIFAGLSCQLLNTPRTLPSDLRLLQEEATWQSARSEASALHLVIQPSQEMVLAALQEKLVQLTDTVQPCPPVEAGPEAAGSCRSSATCQPPDGSVPGIWRGTLTIKLLHTRSG